MNQRHEMKMSTSLPLRWMGIVLLATSALGWAEITIDPENKGETDVSPATPSWNENTDVQIGQTTEGTVWVDSKETEIHDLLLGVEPGAVGRLLIEGPGTSLTLSSGAVGDQGTGYLSVVEGAQVACYNGSAYDRTIADRIPLGAESFFDIGREEGSLGVVNVDGPNSVFQVNCLNIGNAGRGIMTLTNSGTMGYDSCVVLGNETTGVGILTVDGEGEPLFSRGTYSGFFIGRKGQGELTMKGGRTAGAQDVVMGMEAGSVGSLTITEGARVASSLMIGDQGHATVLVEDGGYLSGSAVMAHQAGSTATVTVTGTGSKLALSENAVIGNEGSATVTVRDGATLSVNALLTLGKKSGSRGVLTFEGSTAELVNATPYGRGYSLIVGEDG